MVEVEFPRNGLLGSTCPKELIGAMTEKTSNTTNNTGFQFALFIDPPNDCISDGANASLSPDNSPEDEFIVLSISKL
jgi:hypothetical protein